MSQQDEAEPLITNGRGDGNGAAEFTPRAAFEDHFSLEAPSDCVRFRTNAVRVYASGTQQFHIIESEDCLKAKVVRTNEWRREEDL